MKADGNTFFYGYGHNPLSCEKTKSEKCRLNMYNVYSEQKKREREKN
jgi:hypothetical protein